jgi:hypothetical protein
MASFTWTSPDGGQYVQLGIAPGAYAVIQAGAISDCCDFTTTVVSLMPGATYYYRVGSPATGWTIEDSFITAN